MILNEYVRSSIRGAMTSFDSVAYALSSINEQNPTINEALRACIQAAGLLQALLEEEDDE